ncbi:MAG: hypothetical protein K1X56_05420 [Flavobacteriales bacterium]|nr:hypothetical protein [Flavobacteriales bacterium]
MSVKKMILMSVLILLVCIIGGATVAATNPRIHAFKFGQAIGQLCVALWVLQWTIWYLRKKKN